MKDLIKKYEELWEVLNNNPIKIEDDYLRSVEGIIIELKELESKQFQNNERILLKRLVTDEIATPRKKYGTSKMNTLFTLQEKLKK